jgi:hypothetical protein
MFWIANVSCVQDVTDALKGFKGFRTEQAMSVGDDADKFFARRRTETLVRRGVSGQR